MVDFDWNRERPALSKILRHGMGATLAGQLLFLRSYNVMYEECGKVGGIVSSEGWADKKMNKGFFFWFFLFPWFSAHGNVCRFSYWGVLHSGIPFSYLVSLRDFLGLLVLSLSN